MEWIVFIVIGIPVLGFLAIPLLAIWTHHKRKMEELAMRKQQMLSYDLRAEFDAVRAEIKALRDTAMQYDISFDASLQSLEYRISQLERPSSVNGSVPPRVGVRASNETGITQNLYR